MKERDTKTMIDEIRISNMKVKYYNLVDAYKKAASETATRNDLSNFIDCAVKLAATDVVDIIFNYSLISDHKNSQIEKINEERLTRYTSDIPESYNTFEWR